MRGAGFWVKGSEIIKLADANAHIHTVMRNPQDFGFSGAEELKSVYREFGEKIGMEGKAREVILKQAMRNGWIRVRHYPRQGYWSIQCDSIRRRKRNIDSFIERLMFDEDVWQRYARIHPDDTLVVTDLDGEREHFDQAVAFESSEISPDNASVIYEEHEYFNCNVSGLLYDSY